MNSKIEAHVTALFANASAGAHITDIKEELLANLNDKYDDLISSGKSDDEAFALVISGIGDIENLLKDMGEMPEYQPIEMEKNKQIRGIFISIGIALYVLSIVPMILCSQFGRPEIGTVIALVICAAATGFIVYGVSISKTKYSKTNNSFVEEYKEKIAVDNDNAKLRTAMSSALWPLLVVLYLAFSFITGWWHISWIIFLVGACVQQLIVYKFTSTEKRKGLWHGLMWTATVILYFIISFGAQAWGWSWMIFLAAAAAGQIVRLLVLWKKAN